MKGIELVKTKKNHYTLIVDGLDVLGQRRSIKFLNTDSIKLVKTKKDHYRLIVDGSDVFGERERSFFRYALQVMDNGIDN